MPFDHDDRSAATIMAGRVALPVVDRRYRDRAGAGGALSVVVFAILVLWLLFEGGAPTLAGSGPGDGSGKGGGSGRGIGAGKGDGMGRGGAGTGASGDGLDAGSSADGASDSAATALDEAHDPKTANPDSTPPARRPPLNVGFTAANDPPPPPIPPVVVKSPPVGASSGSGAAGGGGGQGGTSFMGVEARGKRVVYVIDRSGSMAGDERLKHANYELKRSIRAMPDDGEFFVIYFDTAALPMPAEHLMRATGANVNRFAKWIDQQTPNGGTDPTEAMTKALALGPDTIFLMSDGAFPEHAATQIRAANTKNCAISTIAFHDPSGEALLERIARENEGTYRFVPPAGK